MFDVRDRIGMPQLLPLLLGAGVGVAAVVGSIALSG